MNKNNDLRILDERLVAVVEQFYKEFPNAHVAHSGSVRLGSYTIRRSEHESGLEFKLTDEQINGLILKGNTVVQDSQMINQEVYPDGS